ncbi:transposase-like protein [Paraburkholderia sp. MM5477-R1]
MSKLKDLERLFNGRHFDREVIVLCVRWYLRYKLSLRDLVEMMAERGLSLAHTTILRWVKRLHAGVRQTLESVGYDSRSVVASRRDLRYAQPT